MSLSSADSSVAPGLRIKLLGPLEVSRDGRAVEVTSGRLRSLLSVLALSANRTVTVDALAGALWGEGLPTNTRRSIQTYVSRLRSALGEDSIVTTPSGYELRVRSENVDALRFRGLLDAAAREPDAEAEQKLLVEALTLWRGPPVAGESAVWPEQSDPSRLVELYLAAWERRTDLELALGPPDGLVGELAALTNAHPLRESLWLRLMDALRHSGRHGEALTAYETIRVRLAEELGVDPGPELQRLYARLLAGGTPELEPHRERAVPRQLPGGFRGFVGRRDEMAALHAQAPGVDPTTVVCAISGTAGVGKTALAVHFAHQVADRFADGQIYVNLQGFDPSGHVLEPAEVLRGFLHALGVPSQQFPDGLADLASMFRSRAAGRRLLVVLDNARDAAQVRPLLPGHPGCLVVITSRRDLSSLVASEGARLLHLDLMSADEARALLEYHLGPDRVAVESDAIDDIIGRCARLPLALAVAAARATARHNVSLEALAGQLGEAGRRLDALNAGDPHTDLRRVVGWSYESLTTETATFFRMLGLHCGPDISLAAAASMAAVSTVEAARHLDELCRDHLVTEHVAGRFVLHDLLRVYARELAYAEDRDADRRAATRRMLGHYVHTGRRADLLLNLPLPEAPPAPEPGVIVEEIADAGAAQVWFLAEHRVLSAALRDAFALGFDAETCDLQRAMRTFLFRQGHWSELLAAARMALAAAQRLADESRQVVAHRQIASTLKQQERFDEALVHLRAALDLATKVDDPFGQALTHLELAYVYEDFLRDLSGSLGHAERALELMRISGSEAWQARALNAVAWCNALLGDHEKAIHFGQEALSTMGHVGDRAAESDTLNTVAYAYRGLGRPDQAITYYRRAVELARRIGRRYAEADVLDHLAETYRAVDDIVAARDSWQLAQGIFERLGHSRAREVDSKLRQLPVG